MNPENDFKSIFIRVESVLKQYQKIIARIKSEGGTVYLVGGKIRDSYLYIDNNDIDFCVTGITPDKFREIFPDALITGKFFPVFHLAGAEFAFARKEQKDGAGHKGFRIVSDPSITIEEDLARRDLTINAIALKMEGTMTIIDPFGGIHDLRKKVLRYVNADTFKEDPLRVYRVARFSATLGCTPDKETLKVMNEMKDTLLELPSERVYAEMYKALGSEDPSMFFNTLKSCGVLAVHFPEIAELEEPVYTHTMRALDASVELTDDVAIRYAVLLHDIGKGWIEGRPPSYAEHDKEGVELIKKLSRRLKTPRRMEKMAEMVAAQHMKALKFPEMRPGNKLKLLTVASNIEGGTRALVAMVLSDSKACEVPLGFDFCTLIEAMNIFTEVSGADILKKYPGVKGKAFGQKLFQERAQYISLKIKRG